MCLNCEPFKANMNVESMKETLKVLDKQLANFRALVEGQNREVEGVSMELALGFSEVFEALKKIASGDPSVRLPEDSDLELVNKLKHMVNMTAEELGEIVDLSHEFAIGLAEHFDALHKVSTGDLTARVSGTSQVKLLESLKEVTNEMIGSVSTEITERKRTERELEESFSLLSSTLESTADGILVVDREGKITSLNNKFLHMWRIPESIIASGVDNKALSFVLEQLKDPEGFISKVEELYAKPEAESYDILEFKDGRFFERYSQPQLMRGKVVGRVWSFRDVTEAKRAEERLQKMNECFLNFGANPTENINLLTKLSGELLGATSALYNRLQGGLLCSLGQWNTPSDYDRRTSRKDTSVMM